MQLFVCVCSEVEKALENGLLKRLKGIGQKIHNFGSELATIVGYSINYFPNLLQTLAFPHFLSPQHNQVLSPQFEREGGRI